MARLAVRLAALALGLLASSAVRAELLEAELTVAGMACPFCVFGIEKKLSAIDGVQSVTVLLDEGRVRLVFSPSNHASTRDIRDAVKSTGFKLSELVLHVRGQLLATADEPTLDSGNAARFKLLEAQQGRVGPLSAETQKSMERASNDRFLIVQGAVRSLGSEIPGLVVEAFEGGEAAAR